MTRTSRLTGQQPAGGQDDNGTVDMYTTYATEDVVAAVAVLLSDTLAELIDERDRAGLPVRALVPLVADVHWLVGVLQSELAALEQGGVQP
jgi:hypothetical protein